MAVWLFVTLSCFLDAATLICCPFKFAHSKLNLLFTFLLFFLKNQQVNKVHSACEGRIHNATCKSLSVAQQFLNFAKLIAHFQRFVDKSWERVSCLVFQPNLAFFNWIHVILFSLCCVFPFASLTNYITVIRRTLIASLLADLSLIWLLRVKQSKVFPAT